MAREQDEDQSLRVQLNLGEEGGTVSPSEIEDFIETDDQGKPLPKKPAVEKNDDDHDDDEHDDEDQDDDRSGKVDTELADAANDAEREAIRAQRRQERKDKRTRGREKSQRLERQLEDERTQRRAIEARLRQLENANMGSQMADLQRRQQEVDVAENQLKAALADALGKGDGATAAEATTRLQQLTTYRSSLQTAHREMEVAARRPPQQHIDPRMVSNAEAFRKKNPWFKGPNAPDPDSRVLAAIDNSLAAEGWDPASDAYWSELETRAKKYLPDRFSSRAQGDGRPYNSSNSGGAQAQGDQPRTTRRSPVPGSGSSSSSGERQATFKLSEARVSAMKASGAWDDPTRKADMIRRYREQDAQQKAQS